MKFQIAQPCSTVLYTYVCMYVYISRLDCIHKFAYPSAAALHFVFSSYTIEYLWTFFPVPNEALSIAEIFFAFHLEMREIANVGKLLVQKKLLIMFVALALGSGWWSGGRGMQSNRVLYSSKNSVKTNVNQACDQKKAISLGLSILQSAGNFCYVTGNNISISK